MKPRPSYFDAIQLSASRRWDQLESDPELAGPWYQLFKQVQSPRHVLSELLQNADDAGATEASVKIEDRAFVFTHNGEDFSKEHFASICRFGYSNKRALHTIGFRGIGFKSTFSLGDTVELDTPSLSVEFNRKRFTQPKWIDLAPKSGGLTQIRVAISDVHRQKEVEKNLEEWKESPVSLLFFKSIRKLRIGDELMYWKRCGSGPVSKTEWMALHGAPDQKYLLAQSGAEPFPDDALAEIREERLLGEDQAVDLPPCKVEIVLGEDGRLYVVLPTGVRTMFPFASNAPFVQDPARLKIKDPETSPTNRWLLERIGSLAATVMVQWLEKEYLDLPERSLAYSLFPNTIGGLSSSGNATSKVMMDAFDAVIEDQDILLTNQGKLRPAGQCVIIPEELIEVWPEGKSSSLLDVDGRPTLSRHVSEDLCERLIGRNLLQRIDKDGVLNILRTKKMPRPAWAKLLVLWAYIESEITRHRYYGNIKDIQIFPVQGKDVLYSADEIVRLGEKRLLQSDADWDFLAAHLLVLNQNWSRFLAEQRRDAESSDDEKLKSSVDAAYAVLHTMDLESSSDVDDVIDQVAENFFKADAVGLEDCVRLAQIAARLNVTIGNQFKFATQDDAIRAVGDSIVCDEDGALDSFFSESWRHSHSLAPDYLKSFDSCSPDEWHQWVSSGRAGLRTFAPFSKKERFIFGRKKLEGELRSLGITETPPYSYATQDYVIQDFDFDESFWEHWRRLAKEDSSFWFKLLDRISKQPGDAWAEALNAQVIQQARNGSRKPLLNNLPAGWILKFRELPCLQDSRGSFRKPSDLLRRTPETESLMDVELFVHGRLDIEANRPLLEILGVRDKPAGPDRLLQSLRTLAGSENPPIPEVEKWYRRLDLMLDTCSTADALNIKAAFRTEKLILTEGGGWVDASGVFLSSDEEAVPGASLIRASVKDLAIWRKIGVADHPTADLAIEWLLSIPKNDVLDQNDLRRVEALLKHHSHRIWNECGHWLNLLGEWVPKESLEYSLSMQSLAPWSHLHDGVKRKTADFQRLPTETTESGPFANLPHLSAQVEDRFQGEPRLIEKAVREPWLNRFGAELRRLELGEEEVTSRVQALAEDLAETTWQMSPGLEIVPYIDGIPAGTPRRAEMVWIKRVLYFDKLPKARLASLVPDRLGKIFGRADITAALNYCFGRTPEEVSEYLEENFSLTPRGSAVQAGSAAVRVSADDVIGGDEEEPLGMGEEVGNSPEPPADDLEDNRTEPSQQEPSAESSKPRKDRNPLKSGILERFARARGFRKERDDLFIHPDGSRIIKDAGDCFPWMKLSPKGETLRRYWVKDHCLEREPLQIEAELWGLIEQSPDAYAFLLVNLQGAPIEVSGSRILSMRADGTVKLFPAAYRLVYRN